MSVDSLNVNALRRELREAQEAVRSAPDPHARALRHRDAAYAAMDLGEFSLAMTHAVTSLDIARATGDLLLQAKAQITIGLVMADVYDDQGAASHMEEAEALSRACGDARGVALAAVNGAHFEMAREQYLEATLRLDTLLRSEYRHGLRIASPQVGPMLEQAFHINYVKSAASALVAGEAFGEAQGRVTEQLGASAELLSALREGRLPFVSAPMLLDVLDALAAYAEYRGDPGAARAYSDERVQAAQAGGLAAAAGRALLDRGQLCARLADWPQAILDATQAAPLLGEAGQELRAVAAAQLRADALAELGRFQEAFSAQRDLTRRAAAMYRAYFQQSAQLRHIELQAQEAELRAAAFAAAALRDPLTGMPNRAAALEHLDHLHRAAQQGERGAAALLDLDRFKSVNDRYGHAAGDAVLQRGAQAIQGAIREALGDAPLLARLGGEEFLLLFPGASVSEAQAACERVVAHLSALEWPEISPELRVTASIGVTEIRAGTSPSDTLREADRAMYAAKRAGREAVVSACS